MEKHQQEFTIKGLKNLLWRQRTSHNLEIKRLEQKLSLQESEYVANRGDNEI